MEKYTQLTFDDIIKPEIKINNKIRLIEAFAGYGSTYYAMKKVAGEKNVESWKIMEWAVKSIQAYKDLHFTDVDIDYSMMLTDDQVIDYLFERGISADYNKPMTRDQIKRMGIQKCRQTYNNIKITNNLVSVCNVHGEDLEIKDTDKYDYIMTYSFPCQDLSLAGKGLGMEKGSGTRSGLLWEIERILNELHSANKEMPRILLLENVPQIHSKNNIDSFNAWLKRLEDFGYSNYWQDMNAKNYGIPQNRNRTFVVSILGNYDYHFPKPVELKLRLKDMLETNVDEKYFLSEKMTRYITATNDKWTGNNTDSAMINREIACTKTTRESSVRADASDYISEDLLNNYPISNLREHP